jgi:hypothetical protein
MRILVAGPPKTGNIWVTCLLGSIYKLTTLHGPPGTDALFRDAVQNDWFQDNSIFHQHFPPSALFLETTAALDCHLATIIRNPYDTFVSLYFFVQNFPKQFSKPENPLSRIYGRPLDDPEILGFLRDTQGGFGVHLVSALGWMQSGRSTMLRYEDLKADPIRTLAEVTSNIQPVQETVLQEAVDNCSIDKMRQMTRSYKKHIRKGKVGDWRNHLGDSHLDAIKSHAHRIKALGYEVFEPENNLS